MRTHSAQFEGYKTKVQSASPGPLIEWCDVCFDSTEHYRVTRSPKMLALGITCKRCRKNACTRMSGKSRRKAEAPLRAAARAERRVAKLKLENDAIAARQEVRIAAKYEPRYCPRCDAVTEREVHGRSTGCLTCGLKRRARHSHRIAAVRAAASPKSSIERHIANPHAACPTGHHEWDVRGICRACLRLKHRWHMSDPEKASHEMWKRAKTRALRKGLPFDIGPADCRAPPQCPVFGAFKLGSGDRFGMVPSLDRITPERGYVSGNVIVISSLANTIKNCWTREQLRAVAECDVIWP